MDNNKIIIINKEKNVTSRDVVNKVSFLLHTKKVGHTGTLDPLATGVLVLTVGRYTKLCDYLTSTYKEYIVTMKLGVKSDTLDSTGNIIKTSNKKLDINTIKKAFNNFNLEYDQVVPIYSAIHVNGKRLYEYARNNEQVNLPSHKVIIKELELLSIDNDIVKFRCIVSKGTYIRSLVRDIALTINMDAIMISLNRTKQGIFDIKDSITIKDIEDGNLKYYTLKDIFNGKIININDLEYFKIKNGMVYNKVYEDEYILFMYHNKEVALYKKNKDQYKMNVLLDI